MNIIFSEIADGKIWTLEHPIPNTSLAATAPSL